MAKAHTSYVHTCKLWMSAVQSRNVFMFECAWLNLALFLLYHTERNDCTFVQMRLWEIVQETLAISSDKDIFN